MRGIGLCASIRRFLTFFVRCVSLELSRDGLLLFRFTFGRFLFLCILVVAIPYLMVFNHLGMWLDDIIFPSWRDTDVDSPLFIVGNARSGTTFLHRLIQQADSDVQFTTFRTWEIIFGVSITWKLLFYSLYWLDQTLFGTLGMSLHDNVLMDMEKRLIGDISVHAVGLQEPEEDEWLMVHIGLSQLIMFFFPLGGAQLNPLVYFDSTPPIEASCASLAEETKKEIFQFYRDCVKRHLYFKTHFSSSSGQQQQQRQGQRKKWFFISKNPPFTTRLASLATAFPSAKIAVCVRDPVQSVPSMVSYISLAWQAFACPVQVSLSLSLRLKGVSSILLAFYVLRSATLDSSGVLQSYSIISIA